MGKIICIILSKIYMRIAIIDGINQDIGLNILFPDADYYINNVETNKLINMKSYNITPKYDWSHINDTNYDYLFIIISLYDAKPGTIFFKQNIYDILERELKIINENNFKKIYIFDNYDYDYDPNEIINNEKVTLFFKRNYNKTKIYKNNVVPFPFIMFGEVSIIEKLDNIICNLDNSYKTYKTPDTRKKVFFTGSLFVHKNEDINYCRNRVEIYVKLSKYIYTPDKLKYNDFLREIKISKFCLDLNGVGDPNKRTFEILSQGSLMISEYNDLKWPFEETFSEETIFNSKEEFIQKFSHLVNDENLYMKCLKNQNHIVLKYFNKEWIKNYILSFTYFIY